jgi:hypothetical protein
MDSEIPGSKQTIDFVLREGQTEILCRISFEAPRHQAGADQLSQAGAEQLLQWYRSPRGVPCS